jgi:raffinose/stachyose/melibiose transport system permease protein
MNHLKKNNFWIAAFLLPTVILFLLIYGVSLVLLFGTSFTEWSLGMQRTFVGIKNYISLFHDSDFRAGLINTSIWVLLQCTIHVAIGVVFALILAQKEFYWKFARTVYMIPNIISSAALGMIYMVTFNADFGAVNSFIRIFGFKDFSQNWFMDYSTAFLTVTVIWLPFAAVVSILVLAEIAAIPESIIEAAKIDGADGIKTNLYIILPMLKNIIGTCVILAGTSMVQKLDVIMITTGGGPGNTTLNLPLNNFGYANTCGVFLVAFGIAMVFIITRLFSIGNSQT